MLILSVQSSGFEALFSVKYITFLLYAGGSTLCYGNNHLCDDFKLAGIFAISSEIVSCHHASVLYSAQFGLLASRHPVWTASSNSAQT